VVAGHVDYEEKNAMNSEKRKEELVKRVGDYKLNASDGDQNVLNG
jgi:hypothetical protein